MEGGNSPNSHLWQGNRPKQAMLCVGMPYIYLYNQAKNNFFQSL